MTASAEVSEGVSCGRSAAVFKSLPFKRKNKTDKREIENLVRRDHHNLPVSNKLNIKLK